MPGIPDHPDDRRLLRLSEALDGPLDAEQERALQKELDADPALRAEWESFSRLDRLVRENTPPVPEMDWAAFTRRARLRREQGQRTLVSSFVYRLARPLAAAAVLAFVVTAGVLTWRGAGDKANVSPSALTQVAIVTVERVETGFGVATARIEVTVATADPADPILDMGPWPERKTLVVSAPDPQAVSLAGGERDDLDAVF